MSVVVAIKYDKGIAIAADRETTYGIRKFSNDEEKIHQYYYSKLVLGAVGSARASQILFEEEELMDYKDILDKKELSKSYCIKNIVPKIFNLMRENHLIEKKGEEEFLLNDFIICSSQNAFRIFCDGTVQSIDKLNYLTIGCGDDFVYGLLDSVDLNNIDKNQARKMLNVAIEKACKNVNYIDDNIDMIFLEN